MKLEARLNNIFRQQNISNLIYNPLLVSFSLWTFHLFKRFQCSATRNVKTPGLLLMRDSRSVLEVNRGNPLAEETQEGDSSSRWTFFSEWSKKFTFSMSIFKTFQYWNFKHWKSGNLPYNMVTSYILYTGCSQKTLFKLQDERKTASHGPPWYLLGIVSFGRTSCVASTPEVYVRWSAFLYLLSIDSIDDT